MVGTWQAVDGSKVIDMNAFERGELYQNLSTTAGKSYVLGFNLSQNPGADVSKLQVWGQVFTFSQDSTDTSMKWEFKTATLTASSSNTLLSFYSLTPATPEGFPNDAEGPAIDEVVVLEQRVLNTFKTGPGGDVLDMQGLMTSINAPHNSTAFTGGFLRFLLSGADTQVQIDADGGGDDYMTAVTLVGVHLNPAGDTGNYIL